MELSQSDFTLLENLGRKLAKAPAPEIAASDILHFLQQLARVSEVRVVTAAEPSGWREWVAGAKVTAVRERGQLPQPPRKGTMVYFDPEMEEAGFLWASSTDSKCAQAMRFLAPQAGTAIRLHGMQKRSRRSTLHEREIVRESLRSRDEERRRIARELHDDLGQSLVSLKINLKWVEDIVRSREEMEEAATELKAARESVGTILGKVRDLSHTLYPNILDSLGLTAAIKELVYQATRRAGIETSCNILGTEKALPKETALTLYRCCQEAVNNAVRHAGASRIAVDVVYAPGEVRVTVEDNGKGFDPGSLLETGGRMRGSGFWTIRQRVADLGGGFRVTADSGKGAAVEITIPTNVRIFDARRKNKAADRR